MLILRIYLSTLTSKHMRANKPISPVNGLELKIADIEMVIKVNVPITNNIFLKIFINNPFQEYIWV